MIDEVLNEIKKAETKAEQILDDANENSLKILSDAGDKAETIIKNAEQSCKDYKKTALENAEKTADKQYTDTLNSAKTDADSLHNKLSGKITELSKEVFGGIVNGNL